jgi:type IV secretion system protein TrbL
MNDLNVIDEFMATFIRYIDSGFGLLGPDVGFLTSVLIGIDITLAGLFWAMGGEDDVIGRFLKKILYIGVFALILNRFQALADIIFRSFAQAGLTAGGGTLAADDLLRPGRLAGTGFQAAWPLLDQASDLLGFTTFFDNFLTIMVLLIAWVIVIVAFFLLAVQMFVCILEFKLTTLAGRRARARQRHFVGHQGDGAGGDRRHRLGLLHRSPPRSRVRSPISARR